MNYTLIRTALTNAVKQALTDWGAPVDVVWEKENEASFYLPLPHVAMLLRNEAAVGIDEIRSRPDGEIPAGDYDKARAVEGQRRLTWVVKVETEDQQDGSGSARDILSGIRTRLRRPDVLSILRSANLAVSTIGDTLDGDFTAENRLVSFATVDVTLLAVENDTAYGVKIIKTVRLENETADETFEVTRP